MTRLHKKSGSKRRKILDKRRLRRAERFTDAFLRSLKMVQGEDTSSLAASLDRDVLLEAVVNSLRVGEERAVAGYLAKDGSSQQ